MAINSKQKGNTFERKIAKRLSERFIETTGIENSFRRNIDSGSFFGGKNKVRTESYDMGKATLGDLVCPDWFKFTVECKHYKDPPSFNSILKQDNKKLDEWLGQARQDSEGSGKSPLVIAKFNNVPEMAFVEQDLWGDGAPITYKGFVIVLLDDLLGRGDEFFTH